MGERTGSVDTKTRYQGVFARHRIKCAKAQVPNAAREDTPCTCEPSYFGKARTGEKTKRHATVSAARNALDALQSQLNAGVAPQQARASMTLTDAREKFIAAVRAGKVRNKWGRPYRVKAIATLEGRLKHDVEPTLGGRPLMKIQRGEIQKLVDDLQATASASSVRGVVNSVRALYRWAEEREHVPEDFNPAEKVRLPAKDENPIERVATPAEFAALLTPLDTNDAVAYGLSGYQAARAEQIRYLLWEEVDLKVGVIELGVHPDARKSEAAHRALPLVPPMLALLKRAYLEQGRPNGKQPVVPPRYRADSGRVSTGGIAKRAKLRWATARLTPITLQEARHTCATWLDAAGVSPKISSRWMGHTNPEKQPGAAPITLARYTHILPEDMERARHQLAEYLVQGQRLAASR